LIGHGDDARPSAEAYGPFAENLAMDQTPLADHPDLGLLTDLAPFMAIFVP
jgi:hypothetical protein